MKLNVDKDCASPRSVPIGFSRYLKASHDEWETYFWVVKQIPNNRRFKFISPSTIKASVGTEHDPRCHSNVSDCWNM